MKLTEWGTLIHQLTFLVGRCWKKEKDQAKKGGKYENDRYDIIGKIPELII